MSSSFITFQPELRAQEQIDLARDLAVLLKSGVSINESVRMLLDEAKSSGMKKLLGAAVIDLEKGNTLSSSLEKSNIKLKSVFISMVKAGEVSGSLVTNLLFLAEWLERNLQLKRDIKSVTLYPKIVFSAAILLGSGLAVFVLPKLIPIFKGMKIQLPLLTRVVLDTATFFRDHSLTVLAGVISFVVVMSILSKWVPSRRVLQRIYLRTPFVGPIIRAYELALYSQLMHILLKSGLTINEAFDIASMESKNIPYQDTYLVIREKLIQGVSLSESIKTFKRLYPHNFRSIIMVGESTGTIESSFENLASYYGRDISVRTKNLPTVLEPILLVSIGLIVGIIALSIILPIYSLSGNLR